MYADHAEAEAPPGVCEVFVSVVVGPLASLLVA